MGIKSFRNYIYVNGSLKEKILQGTYDLLAADRQGELEAESKALLVESVKLLHALGVYTKDFGPKVIGDSEKYLLSWASEKSSSLSLPCYISECHKLVENETKRCDRFGLDRTTKDTLETHIEVSVSLHDVFHVVTANSTGLIMVWVSATSAAFSKRAKHSYVL